MSFLYHVAFFPLELAFFSFLAWQPHLSSMGPACPSARRSNNPVGRDVHPDPVSLACSRLWKCKGAEPGLPVYHVPDLSGLSKLSRKVFSHCITIFWFIRLWQRLISQRQEHWWGSCCFCCSFAVFGGQSGVLGCCVTQTHTCVLCQGCSRGPGELREGQCCCWTSASLQIEGQSLGHVQGEAGAALKPS